MAEKYFPELCETNGDPRATVMFDDGIAYMANAAPESIDVIIVDSTDPVGPAEGLFNRAFYENCLKALRPDGLLVQQSESPLALMHLILDMRDAMRDAGFKDFRVLPFPQPCYPTGWWSCTDRQQAIARPGQLPQGRRRGQAVRHATTTPPTCTRARWRCRRCCSARSRAARAEDQARAIS